MRGNTQTSKQKREELAAAAQDGARKGGVGLAFTENQRNEVRYVGGDGEVAGCIQAVQRGDCKNETLLCMASGQANAEIGVGGGSANSHASARGPDSLPRTSNNEDVFPTLCATDGDKQFIDNQSVDGGRLIIDRGWL